MAKTKILSSINSQFYMWNLVKKENKRMQRLNLLTVQFFLRLFWYR